MSEQLFKPIQDYIEGGFKSLNERLDSLQKEMTSGRDLAEQFLTELKTTEKKTNLLTKTVSGILPSDERLNKKEFDRQVKAIEEKKEGIEKENLAEQIINPKKLAKDQPEYQVEEFVRELLEGRDINEFVLRFENDPKVLAAVAFELFMLQSPLFFAMLGSISTVATQPGLMIACLASVNSYAEAKKIFKDSVVVQEHHDDEFEEEEVAEIHEIPTSQGVGEKEDE